MPVIVPDQEAVLKTYRKDPAAVLDYAYDWAVWVAAGETITTATVTVTEGPDGLAIDSVVVGTSRVTAWVSGGEAGDRNRLTCHILTNQGRTDERTVLFEILDR